MTEKKKKKDDEESIASKLAGFAAALDNSGEDGEGDEFTKNMKGLQDIVLGLTDIIETYKKNNPAEEEEEEKPDTDPTPKEGGGEEKKQGWGQKLADSFDTDEDWQASNQALLNPFAEEINKNSAVLGKEGFGELKMGKFEHYWKGNVFDAESDISRRIAEAPTAYGNADLTDVPTLFNKKLVDTNLKSFDVTNGGVYTTYENSVREASTENTQTPQQVKPGELGITSKIVDTAKDVNDKLEPDPITTPNTPKEWNTDQNVNDQAKETDLTKQIEEITGPNREGFINDKPTTGIQDQLVEAGFEKEELSGLQQAYADKFGARDDRLKKIFSIFGGAR